MKIYIRGVLGFLALGASLTVGNSGGLEPSNVSFTLEVKGLAEAVKQRPNPGTVALASGDNLELRLCGLNSGVDSYKSRGTVRVLDMSGKVVWSTTFDRSFPPGRTEILYKLFDQSGLSQEGQFWARADSSDGRELADLIFGLHPVVPEIPEEVDAPILVLRDRKVTARIAAERTWLELPAFSRFDPILAQASDGRLYAMFQENHSAKQGDTGASHPTFAWSTDAGRTWQKRQITLDPSPGNIHPVVSFGIAGDDQLFVAYNPIPKGDPEEIVRQMKERIAPSDFYEKTWSPTVTKRYAANTNHLELFVSRSTDRGQNWSPGTEVDISRYARAQGLGRFYKTNAGSMMFTCTLVGPEKHDRARYYDALIRSTDGGLTWGDVSLMIPGTAECQLLRLSSGRWLTTMRTVDRPGDRVNVDGKLVNVFGLDNLPTYEKKAVHVVPAPAWFLMHKRTFIAESDDSRIWKNLRQTTTIFGDTPGELIQLRDGRVVFIYNHRYKPHAGVYARISGDQGVSWRPELLALRTTDGYPSSSVLNDGTIVSMIGYESSVGPYKRPGVQVIRWQLPTAL